MSLKNNDNSKGKKNGKKILEKNLKKIRRKK